MSFQLDPNLFANLTKEARQCFLDEDAPEYLQVLEKDLSKCRKTGDFTTVLRAAHSLKGGAGLAALPSLQKLSHQLEDVIEILLNQEESEEGWQLVDQAIAEVGLALTQARSAIEGDVEVNPDLSFVLESFIELNSQSKNSEATSPTKTNSNNTFLIKALTEDLEGNLTDLEELSVDLPSSIVDRGLENFYDECRFLGESLDLPWLIEDIDSIQELIGELSSDEALLLTQQIIPKLREQRDACLLEKESNVENNPSEGDGDSELVLKALSTDLEELLVEIDDLSEDLPDEIIEQVINNFCDECIFLGETLNLSWLSDESLNLQEKITLLSAPELLSTAQEVVEKIRIQREEFFDRRLNSEGDNSSADDIAPTVSSSISHPKNKPPSLNLKISLSRLQEMTNSVEGLILFQGRLELRQQQLELAHKRLKSLTRKFEPIREQVQTLYNKVAIGSSSLVTSDGDNGKSLVDREDNVLDKNFDSLELDSYTELHTELQNFQELMVKIDETRQDIDLINKDLAENVEKTENNLTGLYQNITKSRLVPFIVLAQRFVPQIKSLNTRYNKGVELIMEGEDTLIDRVILEQLQTPITHLLNNAYDHGIESVDERLGAEKNETPKIILKATTQSNQVIITLKDNGRGIDLYKVYQKALKNNLCSPSDSFEDFQPQEIINWIFEPEFSTASNVSDISGRGMGLDIVRSQIQKLRGVLEVDTKFSVGTTFSIRLPLDLSLVYLLLVRLSDRTIAIPSDSIKENLLARELEFVDRDSNIHKIKWQGKVIPFISLPSFLRSKREPLKLNEGKIAIVLKTSFGFVATSVDELIVEKQFVVKQFDDVVPLPPYICGCTILGTGEVIPVILPRGFVLPSSKSISSVDTKNTIPVNTTPTVLIAEDSVATRRMLEKVFRSVGFKVISCRDGQEALEQFNSSFSLINIVVSDIEMPRLNGYELLEKIRKTKYGKGVPIVMATSRNGEVHRRKAMNLGANDYLGKPVNPQELLEVVTNLLMAS